MPLMGAILFSELRDSSGYGMYTDLIEEVPSNLLYSSSAHALLNDFCSPARLSIYIAKLSARHGKLL